MICGPARDHRRPRRPRPPHRDRGPDDRAGLRDLVAAPLHYQDRVIGTLELGSPRPGDFSAAHLPKLHEVLPLFAMAVQRSMEELNARIQTEIKEQFTAIHPVVEWRFRKAVLDGLERRGDAAAAELEPIVFENVYPLYALSDIRGSSDAAGAAPSRPTCWPSSASPARCSTPPTRRAGCPRSTTSATASTSTPRRSSSTLPPATRSAS